MAVAEAPHDRLNGYYNGHQQFSLTRRSSAGKLFCFRMWESRDGFTANNTVWLPCGWLTIDMESHVEELSSIAGFHK